MAIAKTSEICENQSLKDDFGSNIRSISVDEYNKPDYIYLIYISSGSAGYLNVIQAMRNIDRNIKFSVNKFVEDVRLVLKNNGSLSDIGGYAGVNFEDMEFKHSCYIAIVTDEPNWQMPFQQSDINVRPIIFREKKIIRKSSRQYEKNCTFNNLISDYIGTGLTARQYICFLNNFKGCSAKPHPPTEWFAMDIYVEMPFLQPSPTTAEKVVMVIDPDVGNNGPPH
jgi:hypothetical protein